MEWIKCSDRLPEKDLLTRGKNVLGATKMGNAYFILREYVHYFKGKWRWSSDGRVTLNEVTHWMPLPAPPQS